MTWATPADMALRYDVRGLLELPSDTNAAIDEADLDENPVLLELLSAASGEVDSAVRSGERYTTSDLQALTGTSLSLLKQLVCHIAWTFLRERRGGMDVDEFDARMKWSGDKLDRLRRGENVFATDDPDTAAAMVPSREVITPSSVIAADLTRDRTRNYYPHRSYPR